MSEISQEKLDWLESIGGKKLEHPATWVNPNFNYSDEYLSSHSLDEIKAGYRKSHVPGLLMELEEARYRLNFVVDELKKALQ